MHGDDRCELQPREQSVVDGAFVLLHGVPRELASGAHALRGGGGSLLESGLPLLQAGGHCAAGRAISKRR